MAYKSVVVDGFYEALIPLLRQVEQAHGQFALAMLVPSFPNPRKWDLITSAHWLDRLPSTRQGSSTLQAEIEPFLGAWEDRLGFIRVRNVASPSVQTLVPVFDVGSLGTAYAFTSLEQTLFDLDEVVVLVARPALLLQQEMKLSA